VPTSPPYTEGMAVVPELRNFDLRAILLRIAELDIRQQETLGDQFVQALSRELHIDRLTHAIVARDGRMLYLSPVGIEVSPELLTTAGKLILRAIETRQPLVYRDMREHPDLMAMWAEDYRTNSCAVLPMLYRGGALGALCLSNLTEKQVMGMQMQRAEIAQFMLLSGFITALQVRALGDSDHPDAEAFRMLLP
jgi:GAF domain-containing protein